MNLKVMIKSIVSDKNGKVFSETEKEANSFIQALIFILCVMMRQTALVNQTKDLTGVLRTLGTVNGSGHLNFAVNGAAGDILTGILVGTSNQGVSLNDSNLISKITHGSGAGQLMYGGTTVSDVTLTVNQAFFQITRQFQNISGADITVNEVGLESQCTDTLPTSRNFLVDRTVSQSLVPNGLTLTEVYSILVTV